MVGYQFGAFQNVQEDLVEDLKEQRINKRKMDKEEGTGLRCAHRRERIPVCVLCPHDVSHAVIESCSEHHSAFAR